MGAQRVTDDVEGGAEVQILAQRSQFEAARGADLRIQYGVPGAGHADRCAKIGAADVGGPSTAHARDGVAHDEGRNTEPFQTGGAKGVGIFAAEWIGGVGEASCAAFSSRVICAMSSLAR